MKKIILFTSTILFSIASINSFAQQKPKKEKPVKETLLDGKRFSVNLSDDTKKAGEPKPPKEDVLTFKSSKFKSKLMEDDNKFKGGFYKVTSADSSNMDAKKYSFEVIQKLEGGGDDETLNWSGTIDGEDIEGTALWIKKGKTKREYSFYGSEKQKK